MKGQGDKSWNSSPTQIEDHGKNPTHTLSQFLGNYTLKVENLPKVCAILQIGNNTSTQNVVELQREVPVLTTCQRMRETCCGGSLCNFSHIVWNSVKHHQEYQGNKPKVMRMNSRNRSTGDLQKFLDNYFRIAVINMFE